MEIENSEDIGIDEKILKLVISEISSESVCVCGWDTSGTG